MKISALMNTNPMKHTNLFLCFIALILSAVTSLHAQEVLDIKFELRVIRGVPQGVTSSRDKKQDRNGAYMAVIRVGAANIQDYTFDCQYLLKSDIRIDEKNNEATLFIASGHPTNLRVTNTRSDAKPVTVELGALDPLYIYDLTIDLVRDKSRTLILPVLGLQGITDFGAMIAIVKKIGPYAKFTSNFVQVTEDGECTDEGNMVGAPNIWPYYNNETKKTRLSATLGVIYRLWQGNLSSSLSTQGLYVYAGGGYGYANCFWKTTDNRWLLNTDHSHTGFELECGALYRYKALAISAGVQTNSFKYSEAVVGLGIMF